jgi:hypothetical protein
MFELTHSRLVPPASIASLAHTSGEWCAHGIEETDLGEMKPEAAGGGSHHDTPSERAGSDGALQR